MEQRFGYDFSRVRVHSGAAAEQSARDVNAHAYTVGHNIVFGAGGFAPGTHEGRRLMAHELTHMIQQGDSEATFQGKLQVGAPGDAYEREADAATNAVASGMAVAPIRPINRTLTSAGSSDVKPVRTALPPEPPRNTQGPDGPPSTNSASCGWRRLTRRIAGRGCGRNPDQPQRQGDSPS